MALKLFRSLLNSKRHDKNSEMARAKEPGNNSPALLLYILNLNSTASLIKCAFKQFEYFKRVQMDQPPKQEYQEFLQSFQMQVRYLYDRLLLLGQYGRNVYEKGLKNVFQYFHCSQKAHLFSRKKLNPEQQQLQKCVRKIIQYYQKGLIPASAQNTISPLYINNPLFIQMEENIATFYKIQKLKKQNSETILLRRKLFQYMTNSELTNKLPDAKCLRCRKYFLKNEESIYNPSLSFYSVHTYALDSYQKFSDIEGNVRTSMCTMLNEPKGGIVLLGCKKVGSLTHAKGFFITEKLKDSLQQKIEGFFNKFIPKVKRNQEVFIDFVPIMEYDFEPGYASDKKFMINPIEGNYICRIFLKPKQPNLTYFIKPNTSDKIKILVLQANVNDDNIVVDNSKLYQYMIKKHAQNCYQNRCDKQQHKLRVSWHYNVNCTQPDPGKPRFAELQITQNKRQTEEQYDYDQDYYKEREVRQQRNYKLKDERQKYNYDSVSNRQTAKSSNASEQAKIEKKQKKEDYKFWTLIVGDKTTMSKILQTLNVKQKLSIMIEKLYDEYNFKLTKTTWIMLHDEKFQLIKKTIDKYNITYKSKPVKMIASNVYLQVEGGINQMHYHQLYQILNSRVGSSIKAAEFKPTHVVNSFNWVLWMQDLKSSIFSYFYLSDLNYKVTFIRGASYFTKYANQPKTVTTNNYNDYNYNTQYQY